MSIWWYICDAQDNRHTFSFVHHGNDGSVETHRGSICYQLLFIFWCTKLDDFSIFNGGWLNTRTTHQKMFLVKYYTNAFNDTYKIECQIIKTNKMKFMWTLFRAACNTNVFSRWASWFLTDNCSSNIGGAFSTIDFLFIRLWVRLFCARVKKVRFTTRRKGKKKNLYENKIIRTWTLLLEERMLKALNGLVLIEHLILWCATVNVCIYAWLIPSCVAPEILALVM